MAFEVKIPAVGESITSGLISVWHKNDGDTVAVGEPLFTLETDKVSTEILAEKAGVLKIKAVAGTEVKIGETVADIGEGGAAAKPEAAPSSEARTEKPAAPVAAAEPPASNAADEPDEPETSPVEPPAPVQPKTPATMVSPVAAERFDSTPAAISAAVSAGNVSLSALPEGQKAGGSGRVTRKKLSPLRRKIAQQLVMAQHTAAILTTFNECDMSAVMKLRSGLQEAFTKEHGIKLGFMSFFIKAAVSALKATPAVNGRMEGDDFIQNHFYDIGVAVGTERGLVVPVIRDADKKSFADIERDLVDYATKAREGKIRIEDLQGGVFTISNGGIYGSLLSTPILNPPQSGILGMHKIQERPVAEKGQVVVRPMMYLALSYDHRVVDGKEAVTFLVRVKDGVENPSRLLLDL